MNSGRRGGNWVRFAFLGRGDGGGGANWVRFAFLGRIQESGEGGPPLARVLSDGGWLGMACNSPCFRCCFILNYATHYTIKFGRCPILNKINYEDTKGRKGIMNIELRNIESVFAEASPDRCRRVAAGLRPAFYLMVVVFG